MAEQITGIQQVAYSREVTWNTAPVQAATSGTTTTLVDTNDPDESILNKFKDAMVYCANDASGGNNDEKWRKCDGFDPSTDTTYFLNDAWQDAWAATDTYQYYHIPRYSECSLSRDLKFGDRSGYKRESLYKKFDDPYIRAECGLSLTAELTGMGKKASYGELTVDQTGTTIVAKAGHAARFAAGQNVVIVTSGLGGGTTWNVITAVDSATETLTVTPAVSGTSAANDPIYGMSQPGELGVLMAGAIGSVLQAGRGSEATGAGTASAFDVNAGHGAQFVVGGIIGVGLSTGTEWTQITAKSTDTLTVSPALSATPSAGNVIYNSWTIQPADTGHESFTFTLYKHAIRYVINGCKVAMSIEGIETDAIPQVKFEALSGGADARTDNAIPSDWDDAYSSATPPVPVCYYLQIAPTLANTASKEFTDASFELGSDLSRRYAPSATQGIANVSVTGWKAPVIKCKLNKEALSTINPFTAATAGTLQRVRLILGGTPGSTVVIDFRQAQTLIVNEAESDGRDYWEVEFHAKDDASSATLPPFVVALG